MKLTQAAANPVKTRRWRSRAAWSGSASKFRSPREFHASACNRRFTSKRGTGFILTFNIRSVARNVILFGVAVTPLLSAGELISLLRGSFESQLTVYTPLYLKAIKDVISVVLILLGALHMLRSGRTNRVAVPFLVLMVYTAALAASTAGGTTLAVAGIRWILPVFVAFFIYDFVTGDLLSRIARLLSLLLVVQVVLQVGELYFMNHWYGAIVFGLAARVPGFFVIPNTAGFFAVTSLFFARFYGSDKLLRRSSYLLAPASVILTQSGTGLIVLVLVGGLLLVGARRVWIMIPAGIVIAAVLLPLLPVLTGRSADYVAVSGGTRVQIFADLLRNSEWVPAAFGNVTNTAVSLVSNGTLDSGVAPTIADSTYASLWGNLGIAGGIFFGMFLFSWGIAVVGARRLDLYVATAIFLLYGFTTIVFESYPMNMLLAVCAAYFLSTAYLPFWLGRPHPRASRYRASAPTSLLARVT